MRKLFTLAAGFCRKIKMPLVLLIMVGSLFSGALKAQDHFMTLNDTAFPNKVKVAVIKSHNACFWIGGGWSKIEWYLNDTYLGTAMDDYCYGMALGYQTIIVNNKEIDCTHLTPGSTVKITAKAYHHDAYSYAYYATDLVAYKTLLSYTNVSNVQATDALYMTKINLSWNSNEQFDNHSYRVRVNGIDMAPVLGAGTTNYLFTGIQPGYSASFGVKATINGVEQISSTNSGSTFNPNLHATTDLPSSIVLSWNDASATYQANGFILEWKNSLNNWEVIWDTDYKYHTTKTLYSSDHTMIPGYTYEYRLKVKPVGTSDVVTQTTGKTKPNGTISGYVRTPFPSQVPVSGVLVEAVLVGGPLPSDPTTTYSTYTDMNGYYEINNIYYYDEADFVVTPIYDDRDFDPDNQTVTLAIGDNTKSANFTDLSSFTISGNINNGLCPVPNVSMVVDNDTLAVTDIDGNYTLTVSTGGTYVITPQLQDHYFDLYEETVVVSADITGVDFSDTTVYLIEGHIEASCNTNIGTGTIHFYSTDALTCFDTGVVTDANGYYSIYLPAQSYYVVLTDFTADDPGNLDAMDVLAFFSEPKLLDLTYYDDELFEGDTLTYDLTYRTPPTLQMSNLGYISTCSGEVVPLVKQYEPLEIQFNPTDDYLGNQCPAGDGIIIIRENLSSIGMDINTDTIPYTSGQVITYELTPGTPNLIEAQGYKKFFEATLERDGQTDVVYQDVIVLGDCPREQNFTTVSPQIPFHVLHNPPGDASYSFLETDQTITSSFSQSFLQEGSVDTYLRAQLGPTMSLEVGFIAGGSIELDQQFDVTATLGLGSSGLTDWATVITTSVSELYQTSGNVNITGGAGDVYIGGAMNMLYGVTDILTYDFVNCEIEKSQTLYMQPTGLESTFMYTESHITDVVIPELQYIADYLTSINNTDSASFYIDQINTWQQFVTANHENIASGTLGDVLSISGGVGYTNTLTTSRSDSRTFDWNIYIDYGVAVEVGASIGGVGLYGGVAVQGRSTWGKMWFDETETTNTVGYYLGDDDLGDDYLVQVVTDKVYGTPAFILQSGQTMCPFEEGTVPREGVQLTSTSNYQSVEENDEAVFILQLANTSQTDEEMTYDLIFDHTTNPGGASLTIGGSPIVGGIPYSYTVPAWGSVDVTITVSRGPINYDYNGLKFIMKSQCDDEIADEEYLNVHFYKMFDLDLAVNGSGTTNLSTGIHSYEEGTIVNLYASPSMGYEFQKWIVGSNEYFTQALAVTMDEDKTATAYFAETTEPQYTVNISLIGSGTTQPPAGTYIFNEGHELLLTAYPELYNAFVKWTINGEEVFEPSTTITISENTTIVAEFIGTHQLTILTNGEGYVNPEAGYYTVNDGSEISLYAYPELGYVFEKWIVAGDEFFTQYITFDVTEDIIAVAYFTPTIEEQHAVEISVSGLGGTTIPPAGEYLYVDGSILALTAVPNENYLFQKWIINGIETTNNPVNFTVTGEFNAVAYFTEVPVFTENYTQPSFCTIFPNPSNGIAEISSEKTIDKIEIYDITGKIILNYGDISSQLYTISLEQFNQGIYIVKVYNGADCSVLKMQIVR